MSGTSPTGTEGARPRRGRFAVLASAILLSATVCMVSVVEIGRSSSRRFDVTATGEHRLAPRTMQILDALPDGSRIVLAMDKRTIEPSARAMLEDVLATFERSSDRIGVDWIDTAGEAGQRTFARTLADLMRAEGPSIDAYARTMRRASEAMATAAAGVDPALATGLERIRDALDAGDASRQAFDERAALFRVLARDGLATATAALTPIMEWEAGGADRDPAQGNEPGLPRLDDAWQTLRGPAENLDAQLDGLARELAEYAKTAQGTPSARDMASGLARTAATLRAPLARAIEQARAARAPAVIRVARLIESDRAAIVVGQTGPGIVGIDPDALVAAAAAPAAEARGRVESLFATALGTLITPSPPIVVLVHAENPLLLARANLYQQLIERLSARGIDTITWSLLSSTEPPSLREIDPDRQRPVVYVALSTDSSTRSPGPGQPSGIERAQRLGAALKSLFERGESILISTSASVIPSSGSPDPTIDFLAGVGVLCDTARPLVRERLTPSGRVVTTPLTGADRFTEVESHPVAGAIRGLPLFMAWPIRVSTQDQMPPGVTAEPLLAFSDASMWGESQWITLWQVGLESQATMPSPPTRDARDSEAPAGEPVTLAWAIQRRSPEDPARSQRIVVVGTHSYGQYGWFADGITHEQTLIDGRPVRLHPGNIELFDASIAYLAGMDQLIAQSPEARSTPVIGPIDEGRLRALRIALGLGMPGAVLVIGVIVWLIRR